MDKPKVKKQHFVPQFLLRNFADSNEKVWIYDKVTGKSVTAGIADIATGRYFYDHDILDEVLGKKQFVENKFADAEGAWHSALDPLLNRVRKHYAPKPSDTERWLISEMAALQAIRTKQFRGGMKQNARLLADDLVKRGWVTKEEYENFCAQEIANKKDNTSHLNILLDLNSVAELSAILHSHVWVFRRIAGYGDFYISDNPVARYDHNPYLMRGGTGLGSYGVEVHMPLSHDVLLVMVERKYHRSAIYMDGLSLDLKCHDDRFSYNSQQVEYSSQYLFSLKGDFQDAERACRENPEFRDPDRVRSRIS